MERFQHVIADASGLHARPVAQIAVAARAWRSTVTVACRERTASATDLVGLMGLDARCGDTLSVCVEGPDEHEAAEALKPVFII